MTLHAYTIAELLALPRERIAHGHEWGPWRLNARNLTLIHVPEDYEIDLESCVSSARVLDWIFQVSTKTWCTKDDAADLLTALHDVLDPQANLCSFGVDKRFAVTRHLRERIEV